MASVALQELESAILKLQSVFLPRAKKTAPEVYSDEEITAAKGFLVFAHAELEEYLEKACRDKANRALDELSSNGVATITALSLLSYCGTAISEPADLAKYKDRDLKLAPAFPTCSRLGTRALSDSLKTALGTYTEKCRKNNGVKETNLLQLIVPLGVNPMIIDVAWIAELNGFGVERGAHAHRGLSAVTQISDPFAPAERLDRILNGPPGSAPPAGAPMVIYSLKSLDDILFL